MKIGRRGIATTAIVAIVVTVVIVVIAGVSAVVLLTPKEGAEGTPTSTGTGTATGTGTGTTTATGTATGTTTPTTTPTTTLTTTPGGGVESTPSLLTRLDYKIDITSEGQTSTYRYRARNMGTTNLDLRVDMTISGTTMSYILSGSQQQGWIYTGGQWMSFSDIGMNFSEYWSDYSGNLRTYMDYLPSGWVPGEEWSGTYGGVTYRIYDIQVNPSLPDSVFLPG